MRSKSRMTTVAGVFLLLIHADISYAQTSVNAASLGILAQVDAKEAADEMPPPQGRVERRRGSRGLCAGIGIVVGAILGGIFGSGRSRDGFNETAAVAGGVGTSMICRSVRWRSVHRRDQDEVNRRVAAMTVDPSSASQSYSSDVTGKTYNITAGERTYQSVDAEFTTIEQVAAPQMGANISATPYRVTASALNLRASPGTDEEDRITGAFYQGDVIESLSETPDGQWVLVGYQNVGYGWVARRFLEPVAGPRDQLVFAVPGEPPPPPQAAPVRAAPRQRRAGTAAPSRPTTLAAAPPRRISAPPPTRTQMVRTQMVCRGFTVSDGRRSDRHNSCAGPRGQIQIG